MQRLEEPKQEEGISEAKEGEEDSDMSEDELFPKQKEALDAIRKKKKKLLEEHRVKKNISKSNPCGASHI